MHLWATLGVSSGGRWPVRTKQPNAEVHKSEQYSQCSGQVHMYPALTAYEWGEATGESLLAAAPPPRGSAATKHDEIVKYY